MRNDSTNSPKVFISYSWKPTANRERVMQLAERLMSDGVNVVIDVWDLKEGNDIYKFMERMVNDQSINRVLLISNKNYMERANKREGGAGTEGAIVSPSIYKNADQQRFVPIVFERDEEGKEYLPTFIGGRFYIDLSSDDTFEMGYEELLRNLYDRPKSKRPPLGRMPDYLNDDTASYVPTIGSLNRLRNLIENDKPFAVKEIKSYLRQFIEGVVYYKVEDISEYQDSFIEEVERRINALSPLRENFMNFLDLILDTKHFTSDLFLDFFEELFRAYEVNDIDLAEGRDLGYLLNDHFRFFNKMLFLQISNFLLKNKQFAILKDIVKATWMINMKRYGISQSHSFLSFRKYNRTLDEYKNEKYGLNAVSVEGRLMKEILKGDFDDVMNTDIILYYLSLIHVHLDRFGRMGYWYPQLAIYNRSMEIMPRLKDDRYFNKAKVLFDVQNREEFISLLERIKEPELSNVLCHMLVPSIKEGLTRKSSVWS